MKLKVENILISIDETCSVADAYISSNPFSNIEKYETECPFIALYKSENKCAVPIESPHIFSVKSRTISITILKPNIPNPPPTFSPFEIRDDAGFSLLYLPGCICVKRFTQALKKVGPQTVECFECRFLLKQQPRIIENDRLIAEIAEFAKSHHVVLSYPIGYDSEPFLLEASALTKTDTASLETRLSYVSAPQELRETFSLGVPLNMHADNYTAYFIALLQAHHDAKPFKNQRLITALPLFEPGTQQIVKEDRKLLVYYKAFLLAGDIEDMLEKIPSTTLKPASAFGNENDMESKERRLARLAKTTVTTSPTVLNATNEDMMLLRAAGAL